MASERHITERLSAWLDGRLEAAQADEVALHLQGCRACAEERDALKDARSVLWKLPEVEPRIGFAVRVAAAAAEQRGPQGALFWRWTFGGLAGAAAAAALVLAIGPGRKLPDDPRSTELLLAQKLDLYEDLSVVQNREALENLDVVEQLDQIVPEGRRP